MYGRAGHPPSTLSEHLLNMNGIRLEVEPEAKDWLVAAGYSAEYGIRELGRVIDRHVRGPIGAMSAEGELSRRSAMGQPLVLRKEGEGVLFR
jgi:ATP-dependent Clp protease ATP-binding subunit ClpA